MPTKRIDELTALSGSPDAADLIPILDVSANETKGITVDDFRKVQTLHFNIGRVAGATTAPTPGTPDTDALSEFGQVNIPKDLTLAAIHLHIIQGTASGANIGIEVYRRRSAVMTLLTTLTASGAVADYYTDSGTIADTELLAGDYLFAQFINATVGTGGGTDGFTVDLHFTD